ncbi:MAG TPA: methionyl-tRNA formyltransferase [Polyangiales bacterium]|nr:methionyl-tRNA formyltransferase [Polyangiales bacterium]
MSTKPRALFFGTPEFAVPCLSALAELCDVQLVITQPDRPAGRGMKLAPPPVKLRAQELGVPVIQPSKVRTPEFAAQLRAAGAEVSLVVAYGRILPKGVLEAARLGSLNVHASILPKYRGAAPIQWAIVRGERESGVCLMQMDEGLDTGPVLACATLAIGPDETAGELAPRLSQLGAELVQRELPRFFAGELRARPQVHAEATLAPILKKEDGALDFTQAASAIHDRVRGLSPWPGAYAYLGSERVKVHRTRVVESDCAAAAEPGELVRASSEGLVVACGRGSLALCELQFKGGKRLSAAAVIAGRRLPLGTRFAKPEA